MASGVIDELPLVVIVGPTASGKTGLAIELAEKYGGEIISADSRAIYKGLDIGTAKPTLEERTRIVHWGIDIVSPEQTFTAAEFKDYALKKIVEIRARGKIPFLVGGTGLYIDAVLFDYQFGPKANDKQRKKLESMTIEELILYCRENNISLPENQQNKRYIIRAIEQNGINIKRKDTPIDDSIIVGIATDRELLKQRIVLRSEQIFADGVVEEAKSLGKKYGWGSEAMTGNIYPLIHEYLDDRLTIEEVKEKFITLDWRLAKRQLTWLKRNKYIHWFSLQKANTYLSQMLAERIKS